MRRLALISLSAASFLVLIGPAASRPMFSSQERTQGLLEGKGMGLATPAENNGYPGPRHVLDAADKLGLSPEQKQRTAQLFAQMREEAIPAAQRLVADEAALDKLFIDHRADLASITAASRKVAMSESAAQVIHLKYHLAMLQVLTPEQVAVYASLGSHTDPKASASAPAAHHDMRGMSDQEMKDMQSATPPGGD